MTQRNPMNERYQQEDRKGTTRKSAASAKPVAKAAASVHIEGQKTTSGGMWSRAQSQANKKANTKKKTDKQREREMRARYYDPQTPEYKKWRKYWWISIVIALVFTTGSFAVQMAGITDPTVSYVLLGVGYAALIFAIYADMGKVRKIRRDYQDRMMNMNTKAAKRARRAAMEEEKRQAEEARKLGEQERAKRDAKKAARKAKFSFGKKDQAAEDAAEEDK